MKKRLIIIIIIIVIIMIGSFLLFKFMHKEKLPKVTNINESINIEVGGYNQVINVKTAEEYTANEEKYLRIDMSLENKKDIDSLVSLHQFILLYDDKEEGSLCYHEGLTDTLLPSILPNTVKGNSTISGYLYCPIESSNYDKLMIKVISGGKIAENNEISYEYKEYNADLKK